MYRIILCQLHSSREEVTEVLCSAEIPLTEEIVQASRLRLSHDDAQLAAFFHTGGELWMDRQDLLDLGGGHPRIFLWCFETAILETPEESCCGSHRTGIRNIHNAERVRSTPPFADIQGRIGVAIDAKNDADQNRCSRLDDPEASMLSIDEHAIIRNHQALTIEFPFVPANRRGIAEHRCQRDAPIRRIRGEEFFSQFGG